MRIDCVCQMADGLVCAGAANALTACLNGRTKMNAREAKSQIRRAAAAGAVTEAEPSLSAEDRHNWIATAAYYKAQERGFIPGHEMEDWLSAEAQALAETYGLTGLAA